MSAARASAASALAVVALVLLGPGIPGPPHASTPARDPILPPNAGHLGVSSDTSAPGNFSQALNRIVTLLGAAGGAILAIAWTRVALSWFSNDITKKVQAKDRARDALIGSVIFAAALSGLLWALAQWVLTGA